MPSGLPEIPNREDAATARTKVPPSGLGVYVSPKAPAQVAGSTVLGLVPFRALQAPGTERFGVGSASPLSEPFTTFTHWAGIGVAVGVAVGTRVAVGGTTRVAVGVSSGRTVGVAVGTRVDVGVGVVVGIGVAVGIAVAVGAGVDVGVGVGVVVGIGVAVARGMSVGRGVAVGRGVEVGRGVDVGRVVAVGSTSVGAAVDVGIAVWVGVAVGRGVDVGRGVAVGRGVEVGRGVAVGVRVPRGVAVAVGVIVGVGCCGSGCGHRGERRLAGQCSGRWRRGRRGCRSHGWRGCRGGRWNCCGIGGGNFGWFGVQRHFNLRLILWLRIFRRRLRRRLVLGLRLRFVFGLGCRFLGGHRSRLCGLRFNQLRVGYRISRCELAGNRIRADADIGSRREQLIVEDHFGRGGCLAGFGANVEGLHGHGSGDGGGEGGRHRHCGNGSWIGEEVNRGEDLCHYDAPPFATSKVVSVFWTSLFRVRTVTRIS